MDYQTKECCATCARCFKAKKSDYSQEGFKDSDMKGYICMCLADEGIATWIVGCGQNGKCEEYLPKGEFRIAWVKK